MVQDWLVSVYLSKVQDWLVSVYLSMVQDWLVSVYLSMVYVYLSMVQEKVGGSRPRVPQSPARGGISRPNENIHTPATISIMLHL